MPRLPLRITLREIHRVVLAYKKAGTSVRLIRHLDGSMTFEPISNDTMDVAECDLDAELRKFETSHAG
jgi:hypothetical protein